ncbi:hypothetical protein C365_00933 [Cryptococcus neoformans Bt85]|nr:hypothetical protein C365_00933 [Cryptococcus neoformans var. grubii Bt85]
MALKFAFFGEDGMFLSSTDITYNLE